LSEEKEKPHRGGTSKGAGGSKLFGIVLIIAGAFIAIIGILNVVGFNPLKDVLPQDYKFLAGITGWSNIVIGAWGFIGGVGLTQSQEWGWGISLVVFSTVIVTFIAEVYYGILAAMTSGNWSDFTMWLKLVAIGLSAVGIVYLLLTKYKYA